MAQMVFDQLADVIDRELASGKTQKQLAAVFGRERKIVYSYGAGCSFRCDLDFVLGLQRLGYDIQIVKRGR